MPRTLITGAGGFTARYLAENLSARGHEVIGLSRTIDKESSFFSSTIEGNLLDFEWLSASLAGLQPDHVVHLAAIAQVNHSNIEELYRTNIVGTRNVFESLAALKTKPRSVLVSSSANVYGNQASGLIDEMVAVSPANDYAVSKLAVENIAGIYSDKLDIIISRPFNYTGVGQSVDFLVPKIVDHVRGSGDGPLSLGNLDVSRDFSDVRMVADVYARLLEQPTAIGATVNVCSERATSLRELVALVEELSGRKIDIQVNPAFVRKNEVRILVGNAARLRQLIGDFAVPSLSDTLSWMLDT